MFTTTTIRIYNPLPILFILLVTSTILTVGLPIPRQEHGTGSDLIAGEDFLSILMGSHRRNVLHTEDDAQEDVVILEETTAPHIADIHQHHHNHQHLDDNEDTSIVYSTPSIPVSTSSVPEARSSTQTLIEKLKDEYVNDKNRIIANSARLSSDSETVTINSNHAHYKQDEDDGTIISVRVSSTVGNSMINKHVYANIDDKNVENVDAIQLPENLNNKDSTISIDDKLRLVEDEQFQEKKEKVPLVGESLESNETDQEAIASEDTPILIAEASKSDFSVDEVEPISRDYDALPSPIPYEAKPYQGTVIYHNQHPNSRARSVSYSTVIQAIPSIQKTWPGIQTGIPPVQNNSMEGSLQATNTLPSQIGLSTQAASIPLHSSASGPQQDAAHQPLHSAAESKDYYVTSKYNPAEFNESVDKRNYESSSHRYYSPEPTERNWGIPEQNYHEPSKPYTPIVYAQPEQNYEVDEAVSVETNGRAHGIQPTHTAEERKPPKKDDNQKVGYVVEGRNYRKYRVEERTSDGFIVGEYGVVRHDDGSLRGVRYTADGTINPRLIYDALMKFLSL